MAAKSTDIALSWRIKERSGFTNVEFIGEIDENVDFSDLGKRLKGEVVFNLSGVRRINSCGVREWVNFVRDLPGITNLVYSHCSPAIVTQLNMIYNFKGGATLRSFYAPYVCDDCDYETEKLFDIKDQFPNKSSADLPTFDCPECKTELEFDDLPERYLAFLSEE